MTSEFSPLAKKAEIQVQTGGEHGKAYGAATRQAGSALRHERVGGRCARQYAPGARGRT